MSTMSEELSSVTHHLVGNLGPKAERLFAGQIDRARDAGVDGRALTAGAKAPDFVLPDASGEPIRLGSQLEKGPVALVFYRGGWCPYCNIQLRAMQRTLAKIRAAGADLVAISPSTPDNSLDDREREALEFFVLSDSGNAVARSYGLVYAVSPEAMQILNEAGRDIEAHNGVPGGELPVPATYVVDGTGEIRFSDIRIDYRHRTDPKTVIEAIRNL